MKANVFALGLLLSALASGAQSVADYSITVHVQSSEIFEQCAPTCAWQLRLHVTVGDKKYVLQDDHLRKDLLRVGDYKAKVLSDETKKAYEYSRMYEFLLPDGERRKYLVVGESE